MSREEREALHIPVLKDAIIKYLRTGVDRENSENTENGENREKPGERCEQPRVFVDCTLGEGGHSEALLGEFPEAIVYGFDQDSGIARYARERLQIFGDRIKVFVANFEEAGAILRHEGVEAVQGIVMDLGISSYHFDESGRGFSLYKEEPLDMRLSLEETTTAADLVATLSRDELKKIFRDFGEERFAGRIAGRIVAIREETPITKSSQLAAIVEKAVPRGRGGRKGARRIHPATRVFQALRIAVNRELEVLYTSLESLASLLAPGGRICVISFHSLEDRIVKQFINAGIPQCRCPELAPICTCGRPGRLKKLTKSPLAPTEVEVAANPRARSAKLRVAEKLPPRNGE